MERSRVRRSAGVVAVVTLLVVAGLVWWRWPDAQDPVAGSQPAAPSPSPTPTAVHGPCTRPPARPFVPTSIRVAGTVQAVYAVPRTADGVMGVLAHTDKTDFATDQGGVEAGARHGRVLLNTHTWPDGTAMGNRLLAHLHVGDMIILRGHRQVACYRVTSREQVLASNGYPGWDRTTGRPQTVIVVCSGTRLGPGDWTHRTLWFADRYFGGNEPA